MHILHKKVDELLAKHRIMTVATLRPDGWPQATTVGYVHDGFHIYFMCGAESQKAANIGRDNRISLAIDQDTSEPMGIEGLSMAAYAHPVTDPDEKDKALRLLPEKYPEYKALPSPDLPRSRSIGSSRR